MEKTIDKVVIGPIDADGDHMTMEEFKGCVACGGFIDYDGFGHYASKNSETDKRIKPSDITPKFETKYTHVVWYNR